MPNDPYRQAALEFVNWVRARYGYEPLDELPKGSTSGLDCPIHNAIPDAGYAGQSSVSVRVGVEDEREDYRYPTDVRRFVQIHDAHGYPDLYEPRRA